MNLIGCCELVTQLVRSALIDPSLDKTCQDVAAALVKLIASKPPDTKQKQVKHI